MFLHQIKRLKWVPVQFLLQNCLLCFPLFEVGLTEILFFAALFRIIDMSHAKLQTLSPVSLKIVGTTENVIYQINCEIV